MTEKEDADRIARKATNMVFNFFIDIGIVNKEEIDTITVDQLTERMNKLAEEAGYKNPEERGRFWAQMFDKRNRPNKPQ